MIFDICVMEKFTKHGGFEIDVKPHIAFLQLSESGGTLGGLARLCCGAAFRRPPKNET